jgi:hypothetical protein
MIKFFKIILLFFLLINFVNLKNFCYNNSTCKINFKKFNKPCDGKYCGRLLNENNEILNLKCTSCKLGYKTDHYVCTKCNNSFDTYTIFFIIFVKIF